MIKKLFLGDGVLVLSHSNIGTLPTAMYLLHYAAGSSLST